MHAACAPVSSKEHVLSLHEGLRSRAGPGASGRLSSLRMVPAARPQMQMNPLARQSREFEHSIIWGSAESKSGHVNIPASSTPSREGALTYATWVGFPDRPHWTTLLQQVGIIQHALASRVRRFRGCTTTVHRDGTEYVPDDVYIWVIPRAFHLNMSGASGKFDWRAQ